MRCYFVDGKIDVRQRRVGSTVHVHGWCSGHEATGAGDYRAITTLDEGFRPDVELTAPLAILSDADGSNLVRVQPDGQVLLYSSRAAYTYWSFVLAYPAA
ncbi:hypothetical protein B5F40_01805 [Gordonibacter sp. An230]|nr:hypothetical protein B5F40_01805 [Gordonibacter sp. An230]